MGHELKTGEVEAWDNAMTLSLRLSLYTNNYAFFLIGYLLKFI